MEIGGIGMVWRLRRAQRPWRLPPGASFRAKGFWLGLLATAALQPAFADGVAQAASRGSADPAPAGIPARPPVTPQSAAGHRPARADFKHETASPDVRHLADRVVETTDNHNMPFVIVDKVDARVFIFDAGGGLRGAAPALLGLTRGDDSAAGIGDRKLADIQAAQRTTPAGRFDAQLGHDTAGHPILWVDYADAIALHPVVTTKPAERRAQRLASPTADDNRISYGCINVPRKFYETVVSPTFAKTHGIAYVMPETRAVHETFGFE